MRLWGRKGADRSAWSPPSQAPAAPVAAPVQPADHSPSGYAVIDTETTGLSPRVDRIVELAVVLLDEACCPVGELSTLIQPGRHVGASRIHGLTATDVAEAPTFAQVAPLLLAAVRGRVFVAHNAAFDLRFLHAELARAGAALAPLPPIPALCTMTLAPSYLHGLPARTLDACCQTAGIGRTDEHSALADARAAAGLLAAFAGTHQQQPPSWQQLLQAAAEYGWPALPDPVPPTVMVTRAQMVRRHADAVPFLARLVASLPAGPLYPPVQSYLAVLDKALEDRLITGTEAAQLTHIASDLGLTRPQARAAHEQFLDALTVAAWADGVVTETEWADLQAVTKLLGLSRADLDRAMRAAEPGAAPPATAARLPPTVRANKPPDGRRLHVGDSVAFTGETTEPRVQMEQRARSAGLTVARSVSRRTSLLIIADPASQSGKARRARELGTRIVGEAVFDHLLEMIEPTPRPASQIGTSPQRPAPPRGREGRTSTG